MDISLPVFQHQEHQDWLQKIDFYQDQIKIFQKELSTVLYKHSDLFSIIEHVEEYRSILFKKLSRLDTYRQQIFLHEKALAENIDSKSLGLWEHEKMHYALQEFESDYKQLVESFRKFVAHQL